MKAEFTAIIKQDGDWWLGWVEEVPGANAQEETKEEQSMGSVSLILKNIRFAILHLA